MLSRLAIEVFVNCIACDTKCTLFGATFAPSEYLKNNDSCCVKKCKIPFRNSFIHSFDIA